MSAQLLFSVVVPTRNRPEALGCLLDGLANLDTPAEQFEVLVVDDGGHAPLDDMEPSCAGRMQIRILRQAWTGPGGARQTGALQARGQYLAFIDDDCRPAPDWLDILGRRLSREPDCGVGGRVVNALPHNPYAECNQRLMTYCYRHFNRDSHDGRFFTTNNLAFPRKRFLTMAGIDRDWPTVCGEDREVCDRWRFGGGRICYEPEAVVYHAHRLGLRSFVARQFRYGQGSCAYHRARARRWTDGIRLEPVGFYLGLPFRPLREEPWPRALILAGLLLVSQAASFGGFAWQSMRQRLSRREPTTSR